MLAPNEICGVEKYNECRSPSNGIEGTVLVADKSCGFDGSLGWLSKQNTSGLQFFSGERICLTEDRLSEDTPAHIDTKLQLLQAHINLISSSPWARQFAGNKIELDAPSLIGYDRVPKLDRSKLIILLEMNRIAQNPAAPDFYRSRIDNQLSEMLTKVDSQGLDDFAAAALATSLSDGVAAFRRVAPESLDRQITATRPQYTSVSEGVYRVLFPNGIDLTPSELLSAESAIKLAQDDSSSYKIAENAVRTLLRKIRDNSARAMGLMDLRVRMYRDPIDFDQTVTELSALTGQADLGSKLSEWRASQESLRKAVANLINATEQSLSIDSARLMGKAKSQSGNILNRWNHL
jgi:hypothetical protein